jgi:hypothetical protein
MLAKAAIQKMISSAFQRALAVSMAVARLASAEGLTLTG